MSTQINGSSVATSINNLQPTDFSKTTASPEFVMSGKTFYDATGRLRTGTALLVAGDYLLEYEREATVNGGYADTKSANIVIDRTYNGKTLDLTQIMLSGYITLGKTTAANYNQLYTNYIVQDVTRQLQSLQDGQRCSFPISGVYRPFIDNPTCQFYSFSMDVYRDGNQFRMNVRSLYIGNKTGDAVDLTGFKVRTILAEKITII